MKNSSVIIVTLLIALAIATAASSLREHGSSSKAQKKPRAGFIYREGNKLMLNGKQYQSASFNSFQLSGCGFTFPVTDPLLDMIKMYPVNLEVY